jgi:hypothetical protein
MDEEDRKKMEEKRKRIITFQYSYKDTREQQLQQTYCKMLRNSI